MISQFDKYVNQIITEAKKCDGASLRQLSDKENYKWMRCAANPYSPGYKRIYWGRRGKKINLNHCKTAVPGQARYEECKDLRRALIKRLIRKRKIALRNK